MEAPGLVQWLKLVFKTQHSRYPTDENVCPPQANSDTTCELFDWMSVLLTRCDLFWTLDRISAWTKACIFQQLSSRVHLGWRWQCSKVCTRWTRPSLKMVQCWTGLNIYLWWALFLSIGQPTIVWGIVSSDSCWYSLINALTWNVALVLSQSSQLMLKCAWLTVSLVRTIFFTSCWLGLTLSQSVWLQTF